MRWFKKIIYVLIALFALLVVLTEVVGVKSMGRWLYQTNHQMEVKAAQLESHEANVNGTRWHYYSRNTTDATRCVVMVHGITADSSTWLRFVPQLPSDMCVIVPDLAGFGASEYRSDMSFTIPAQADGLAQFLATVLPNATYDLMGSSGGGHVVNTYALNAPNKISSVASFGGTSLMPTKVSRAEMVHQRTGRLTDDIQTREQFDEHLSMVLHDIPWMPRAVRNYLADERISKNPEYVQIIRTVRNPDDYLDARIHQIKVPFLVIWGQEDGLFDVSMANTYAQKIHHAKVVILPNVGHVPSIEQPAVAAQHYLEFLGVQ